MSILEKTIARPILFSGPMVRAILREIEAPGTGKTQTRRVLTPRGANVIVGCYEWNAAGQEMVPTPRAKRGDRLYVREALHRNPVTGIVNYDADGVCLFGASDHAETWKRDYRQGIHMPRWASRLTLLVTDVRVQRLQEISQEDAIAEGLERRIDADVDGNGRIESWRAEDYLPWHRDPVEAYADLWDQLNDERGHGWDTNPWICAITFEPKRGNIDAL